MKSVFLSKAVLLLILCTFFWGSCFPFGKEVLQQVSSFTLIFWRFFIAAICLGLFMKFRHIPFGRMSASQWLIVITVSIVGVGGLNIGLFTGLRYTSSTNGALIMALSPLTTSVIACFFEKRLPSKIQLISLLVSFCGVGVVLTNGSYLLISQFSVNIGDQFVFAGMVAWSLYTYFSQSISRWISVIPYTFLGMVGGLLSISILCIANKEIQPFQELFSSSFIGITEVFYIGLFGTVAGYLLWLNGVKSLGAATASLFFNMVPIFSVLVSIVLGQTVTGIQLIGMVIVIVGLLLPKMLIHILAIRCDVCRD